MGDTLIKLTIRTVGMLNWFKRGKGLKDLVNEISSLNEDIDKLDRLCNQYTELHTGDTRFRESLDKYKGYSERLKYLNGLNSPSSKDEINDLALSMLLETSIMSGFLKTMIISGDKEK